MHKLSCFLIVVALAGPALPQPIPKPLNEGPLLQPYQVKARLQYDQEIKLKYPRLVRGNPLLKEIALTFDDGPHAEFTPKLLDLLRHYKVPATFFVVGKMVDKHPELVQQEVADGHEIANHTFNHYRLVGLGPRLVEEELIEGRDSIRRAVGKNVRLFRPPGGEYDKSVTDVVRRLHMIMVLWTDDPGDYALHSAQIVEERAEQELSNGGIVLLHDGIPATLEALPHLIERWQKRGYRFVTCSQMAGEKGAVVDGGPVVLPGRGRVPFNRRAK